jgi:tetratricopeptide (TPR) repeat protein
MPALRAGLADADPLVRLGATQAAAALPPAARPALLDPRLTDPIRSVRIAAARGLAATPQSLSSPDQQRALQTGIAELIASELASAERPESHLNLSVLYLEQGRLDAAETELGVALRLDPNFVPALVNVADLYRLQNRDAEGERFLRRAIAAAPEAAEPVHALGLLRTRQQRIKEATELLGKAAELQPGNARYAYVYGVALQATGAMDRAIAVLEGAHALHPADRDIIVALIDMQRQRGDSSAALKYADELVRLEPNDPRVAALRDELQRAAK